ncbi:MAG: hypothetical protein A2X36_01075 [Elusimicrobia bacterium GWA2_69_24]|nr:MAG: hypothetical protein A2X36_01075 [Elusimicrobia bacterium GWA2_69_24]
MHEYALAESVIASAIKTAREQKMTKVSSISLRIGELQQMDLEAFRMGLTVSIQNAGPLVSGLDVRMETEGAVFECRVCRRQWTYAEAKAGLGAEEAEFVHFIPEVAHSFIRCPGCHGPDFSVVRGRGVWLDTVQGERES